MAIEWATVGASVVLGAAAWVVTNFVGKPIIEIQATRLKAIETAEQYTYVPVAWDLASEERSRQAKAALRALAASLRGHARTSNWVVRLYCLAARYDLEHAARALLGLAAMSGDPRYHNSTRRNNLNLFYWSIASDHHLTPEQRAEVKSLWNSQSEEVSVE